MGQHTDCRQVILLLFWVLCIWSCQKFFSFEKNQIIPGSKELLILFRSFFDFVKQFIWALGFKICPQRLLYKWKLRFLFRASFIVVTQTPISLAKARIPILGFSICYSCWMNPGEQMHSELILCYFLRATIS